MIKKKNEAKITTEWLKQFKWNKDIWLYKISDDSRWKKPFDVIWVVRWVPTAIEFKFCSLKTKIPDEHWTYKKLEPHQAINLDKFQNAWWKSFVIVYHNETKQYIKFDRLQICDVMWDEIKKLYFMMNKLW